jgi:hypothetical protein
LIDAKLEHVARRRLGKHAQVRIDTVAKLENDNALIVRPQVIVIETADEPDAADREFPLVHPLDVVHGPDHGQPGRSLCHRPLWVLA